jgi:homocysteine S-methyltransferase
MTGSDLLAGSTWVTDGGLETDLIFNHGIDLPQFASFPLVENADGVAVLERYYAGYAAIAAAAGAGLLVETPTWRANPDWGQVLGYNADGLDRANRAAVGLARGRATASGLDSTLVSGVVGPRGDGYLAGGKDPDEAAEYHAAQVRSFAAAGAGRGDRGGARRSGLRAAGGDLVHGRDRRSAARRQHPGGSAGPAGC